MAGPADILHLVNADLSQRLADYSARFAAARPFPHVVIDEFLNPEVCAEVCRLFPPFSDTAALNEDGRVGGKAVQEQVRALGPVFERLDDLVQAPEFISLVEKITGIGGLCYDPWYFGGGTHENRLGQDLDAHVDFNYHPITRQHRRLNLIVYLNEEWEDRWGGSLQLHLDPHLPPDEDEILTVTPLMNRCVIFETSERSWHGFRRISLPPGKEHLSRKSFAIYYYSDSRPASQIAEEHSTIYVERHLPERFVPGFTLGETDVQELKVLLARRDQHLGRLYKQIQETNGRLNRSWLYCLEAKIRAAVYGFEKSTSLRISEPLRALRRAFRGGLKSTRNSVQQDD